MTWEIILILVLVALAITGFLLERIPTDQTSLTVFSAVLLVSALPIESSFPELDQLLRVFSSPAPITIAAMFVISAALEKCGIIERLASGLGKLTTLGYRRFLLLLMLLVAVISAFINNTPVVMVFLPVVLSLSRTLGVPASKLLIPLSYASIFGGCCTLVGTSTNILASSILTESGQPPIGMFEMVAVGGPLLVAGCVYLLVFGDRLLAPRETLTSLLTDEERKEFLTEAYIQQGSPFIGKTVRQTGLLQAKSVRILEVVRNNVALELEPDETRLRAGDRLILGCRPSGIAHARSIEGLVLASTQDLGLETISAHEGAIVEGVIGPRSAIIGLTANEISFRQRFRMILMAIHRRGVNLREKIDNIPLQAGDLLLLMGTDQALDGVRRSNDIFLLDHPPTPSRSLRRKAPWVVGITLVVILLASLDLMPIVAASILGVVAVFATGCLVPKEGYGSVQWSILVLIYGMLGLGLAMETTGAADLMARGLARLASFEAVPPDLRPWLLLAALYLLTNVVTETLSNNATVVLMTPIALSLGATLGVDPRPFVIATCLASSASFATPIGYQTNTYVYGVGGYRFTDFTRIGLPLNLLYFVLAVLLIPWIWPF